MWLNSRYNSSTKPEVSRPTAKSHRRACYDCLMKAKQLNMWAESCVTGTQTFTLCSTLWVTTPVLHICFNTNVTVTTYLWKHFTALPCWPAAACGRCLSPLCHFVELQHTPSSHLLKYPVSQRLWEHMESGGMADSLVLMWCLSSEVSAAAAFSPSWTSVTGRTACISLVYVLAPL